MVPINQFPDKTRYMYHFKDDFYSKSPTKNFFIFSQFVVYSMLSSNKERKNGVATFVFE